MNKEMVARHIDCKTIHTPMNAPHPQRHEYVTKNFDRNPYVYLCGEIGEGDKLSGGPVFVPCYRHNIIIRYACWLINPNMLDL